MTVYATLLLCVGLSPLSAFTQPVVNVPLYGKVTGTLERFEPASTDVEVFRRVPFAQPPVGEYRFARPRPLPISFNREVDATKYGPCCYQRDGLFIKQLVEPSEDCLHLTIWRPARNASSSTLSLLPVAMVILGGGFTAGDSSEAYWDGSAMAAIGDVIVVVSNYRLGALGFLDMGTNEIAGNAGFLDQRAAMEWVNSNIRYFGGDPSRVTLVSNSAGSMSASLHMLTAESWRFFRAAVLDSGIIASGHAETRAQSYERGRKMAALAGCDVSSKRSQLQCLRAMEPSKIIDLQELTGRNPIFSFRPTIRTSTLPFNIERQINTRSMHRIPILLGSAVDDGSFVTDMFMQAITSPDGSFPTNISRYMDVVSNIVTMNNMWGTFNYTALVSVFNVTDHMTSEESERKITDFITDIMFACSTLNFANRHSELPSKTYLYEWGRKSDSTKFGDAAKLGAFHGLSFYHLFGSLLTLKPSDLSAQDEAYVTSTVKTLASFIHDPNSNPSVNTTEWKPYSSAPGGEKHVMRFEDEGPKVSVGHSQEKRCQEAFSFFSKHDTLAPPVSAVFSTVVGDY